MKYAEPVVTAIRENDTTRYYVCLESDIETGRCYAYNPETGYKVITPWRDRDTFAERALRGCFYPWMVEINQRHAAPPADWMAAA